MTSLKRKAQVIIGLPLVVLLLIMLMAPLIACKQEPEPLQITLSPLEGKVEYQAKDTGQWVKAVDGQLIALNDHVRTRLISRAVLYLPDGSKFLLAPATELTVEVFEQEADTRVARLRLIKGAVDGDVATA